MKLKFRDSTSFKLESLLKAIDGTCSIQEKYKAKNIFKLYLDKSNIK